MPRFFLLLSGFFLPISAALALIWIQPSRFASAVSYTLFSDNTGVGSFGNFEFGDASTDQYYVGQYGWSDGSPRTIGKVAIPLTKAAGDISGLTYVVKIWSDSSGALGSVLATSTGVAGSNSWSGTEVEFVFPTPYAASASTFYHFTCESGTSSGSNYASVGFNSTFPPAGALARWSSAGANTVNFIGTFAMRFKIYTTP